MKAVKTVSISAVVSSRARDHFNPRAILLLRAVGSVVALAIQVSRLKESVSSQVSSHLYDSSNNNS